MSLMGNILTEISRERERERKRKKEKTIALAIVSIAYIASRFTNLLLLPVFEDEAAYLRVAQLTRLTGDVFLPMHGPLGDLPPLFVWAVSVFLPFSSDPLVVGRSLSVAFSTLGLLGVYKIGTRLYGDSVGLVAAGMYTIAPLELFFDRQALFDPLVAVCGIWSLYCTILLVQGFGEKKAWIGLASGMVFAPLAKWSGEIFVVLPLVTMILFGWSKGRKSELMKAYLTCLGIYILLFLATGDILRALGLRKYSAVHAPASNLLATFLSNIGYYGLGFGLIDSFASYLTLPIAVFGVFAIALAILRGKTSDRILLLWLLVPLISVTTLLAFFFSRYLVFAFAPLLILMSRYLVLASQTLNRVDIKLKGPAHRFRIGRILVVLFLFSLLLPSVGFDRAILFDPVSAPLPEADRFQYISGHPSGYAVVDAIQYLKNRAMHGSITLIIGWENYAFPLYLSNNPNVTIIEWFRNDSIERNFPHIGETYIIFDGVPVVDGYYGHMDQLMHAAFLRTNPSAELVAKFDKPESFGLRGAVFVYRLNVA